MGQMIGEIKWIEWHSFFRGASGYLFSPYPDNGCTEDTHFLSLLKLHV